MSIFIDKYLMDDFMLFSAREVGVVGADGEGTAEVEGKIYL